MKLTDLTARQIRYYEDQQLITPLSVKGIAYSLNDMWIAYNGNKTIFSEGYNIAASKA